MEYDELKILWEQYDTKLNNLEKLNKKLIMETLKKKPGQKIKWHRFKNLYGMIAMPIILIIALHPEFKTENIDIWFIIGAILLISCVILNFFLTFKVFRTIKKVDLNNDSISDSIANMNSYKQQVTQRYKTDLITCFPMAFLGTIFFVGNFDRSSFIFMGVLLIVVLFLGYSQFEKYKKRIDKLKADIQELEEYE